MTLLLTHPACLDHLTPPGHPERPDRLRAVAEVLGEDRFKALVRDQYFMLLLDEDAALAAIPAMLPANADERRNALVMLSKLVSVRGEPTPDVTKRVERVAALFEAERSLGATPSIAPVDIEPTQGRSKAS